jgi:hypothetical protein
VCRADLDALWSGSGNGEFAEFIMRNNYVAHDECLPPLAPGENERFFENEKSHFPALLKLNQEVIWLSLHVGIVARDIKRKLAQRLPTQDPVQFEEYKRDCEERVHNIQSLCCDSSSQWEAEYPQFCLWQVGPEQLPWRVRAFWDHVGIDMLFSRVSINNS